MHDHRQGPTTNIRPQSNEYKYFTQQNDLLLCTHVSQKFRKIFRAPMYRAHCAVIFAIAQLSCMYGLQQNVIDSSVSEWKKREKACVDT